MNIGSLASISLPHGWRWERLWAIAPRMKATGNPEARPLSVYLNAGVVPRNSRDDNHNRLGEDLSRYLLVSPGDIVFNKLRTWQGGLGVSKYSGIVSPAYFVCRPHNEIDGRFIDYLLHSAPYLTELTRISKWMPPSQFDTPWEELRKLPILLPPLEEQRRIADFLDAETSRIDRLSTLQELMLERVSERDATLLEHELEELRAGFGSVPLRRFMVGMDQGSSPQCDAYPAADHEWGVLKVSAIRPGAFYPQENKRLPEEVAPNPAHEVHEGDLLITRANTPDLVGSAAVVPAVRPRLLLSDKIFRVRLDKRIDPHYVALVARSKRVRVMSAASSNGASQSMANIRFEEVKGWPIPPIPLEQQRALVERINRSYRVVEQLRRKIGRQRQLLEERRRALITAAVTGQFDVSTASGRGIED